MLAAGAVFEIAEKTGELLAASSVSPDGPYLTISSEGGSVSANSIENGATSGLGQTDRWRHGKPLFG